MNVIGEFVEEVVDVEEVIVLGDWFDFIEVVFLEVEGNGEVEFSVDRGMDVIVLDMDVVGDV